MRAAVIGAGQISKQHLGALAICPGVEVVGICDISPVMAEAAADRFGIRSWFTEHQRLLDDARPDVVHILTPPAAHYPLARYCLERGTHVVVEKPVAQELNQLAELISLADQRRRYVLEDHNYQFNRDVQHMLGLVLRGDLGQVRHVDIDLCLDVFGPGSRFAEAPRPNAPPAGTASIVGDFLTHLCYLAYIFIGPHQRVTSSWRVAPRPCGLVADNMQALVDGREGTARLGFSADAQPDTFTVRVQGTRMQVRTNLFETGCLTTTLMDGPKPLMPIRNMVRRGRAEWGNAARSLSRKLSGGPGPYEGLWELVRRFYDCLERRTDPPVSMQQIVDVNRLYHDILDEAPASCAC